ncbi:MAG TPA: hypothetical protein VFB15_03005 [Candidatus Binataceae bacterium]|nr:hypothetical protein [Candidatus Binataceae bacterium]
MLASAFKNAQAEITLERLKIAVAMQKFVTLDDAESCDQDINRLARRNAAPPERAKVLRRRNGRIRPANRHTLQHPQHPARAMKVQVRAKTLQYLDQNQIAEQQPLSAEQAIQQIGFAGRPPVEVIDPDGGID